MLVFSERYSSTKTPLLPCLRGINYYYDLTDYHGGDVDNKLSDRTKLNVYNGTSENRALKLTGGYRTSYAQLTTPFAQNGPFTVYAVMSLTNVTAPNYMMSVGGNGNYDAIGIARLAAQGSDAQYPVPFIYSYRDTFAPIEKNMFETFIVFSLVSDPANNTYHAYVYNEDGIEHISLQMAYRHDGICYIGTHKAKTSQCTTLWKAVAAGNELHSYSETEENMRKLFEEYCT